MATAIKPRDEQGGDLQRAFWMLPLRDARRWLNRDNVAFGVFPCGGPDVEWIADSRRREVFAELTRRVRTDGEDVGEFNLYENAQGERCLIFEER
jgi:hypothetical protein